MIPTVLIGRPRNGYHEVFVSPPPDLPPPPPPPDEIPVPDPWIAQHPGTLRSDGFYSIVLSMGLLGDVLYLGHGQWFGGTHKVAAIDLVTEEPIVGPDIPSEGTGVVRVIGNKVYFPWQDPTGPWESPQGYTVGDINGWSNVLVGPSYHMFDIIEHNGDLWIAGSGPGSGGVSRAMVWRSDDDGATWQESLVVPSDPPEVGSSERFYVLMSTANGLFVRPEHLNKPLQKFNGISWEDAFDSVAPGYQSSQCISANGVFYARGWAFDGITKVLSDQNITPRYFDGTYIYGTESTYGTIHRTLGLSGGAVIWEHYLTTGLPSSGLYALAVTDTWVYTGGTEGRIWRFPVQEVV